MEHVGTESAGRWGVALCFLGLHDSGRCEKEGTIRRKARTPYMNVINNTLIKIVNVNVPEKARDGGGGSEETARFGYIARLHGRHIARRAVKCRHSARNDVALARQLKTSIVYLQL